MPEKLVCVGKIIAAHGIKGAVKIKSYTEIPQSLVEYSPLYNKDGSEIFEIKSLSVNKDVIIAVVNGMNSRNDAELLKGRDLFADKALFSETEEGEFYQDDLIGLAAKTEDGEIFGKILAIHNYGGGDIIEIRMQNSQKTELFAFTGEIFPEVDIEDGYVVICPPEVEYLNDNDD